MKMAVIGDCQYSDDISHYFSELGIRVVHFNSSQKKAVRIQKRFLGLEDKNINGRSRIADLFRVVYIPKLNTEETQEFKKLEALDQNLKENLLSESEYFEDFDVVINIDLSNSKEKLPSVGYPSFAINELKYKNLIYTGDNPSEYLTGITKAIVCINSKEKLDDSYEQWVRDGNKLIIVTAKNYDYTDLLSDSFLNFINKDYEIKKTNYQKELFDWRSLEDYEKVKVKKPIEPSSVVELYKNYVITSIDKLVDREGLFVTVDQNHLVTEEEGIKTFAVDGILGSSHYLANELGASNLLEEEPGYFPLWQKNLNEDNIEEEKKTILFELEKYFTQK